MTSAYVATSARSQVRLRIIAQDPSVRGEDGRILTASAPVPWSRLEPGPRNARIHVVDYDVTHEVLAAPAVLPSDTDLFAVADDATLIRDAAFHAQQVYAVASRTLAAFESALGRRLPWAFGGHQLYVVPHAFAEANAYYASDEHALLFGYVEGEDGSPVYTCLSHDVVAHESTHAVLDGLRHRFLDPSLPDQAAFHEGLADVVALLSVFSLRPVVESCLGAATNGRISRSRVTPEALKGSVLTGVGEQLGAVLTQGRGALRQSALRPPPAAWAEDPAYLEPHRRGEVLVAAVVDILIDIWTTRLKPLLDPDLGRRPRSIDRARAAEEGAKAAQHVLTMMIRGLDYLPPVEFEFPDLLEAVLRADTAVTPDDDLGYRDALEARFAASGIPRPVGTCVELSSGGFGPAYQNLNFAALRSDADEVYRFMWQNAEQLDLVTGYETRVESVTPSQRVGPDGLVVVESVATYVQTLELTAAELSERSGTPIPGIDPASRVKVFGGGVLVFDQFGRATLHISKRLDDWERQIRRATYLRQAGLYDDDGSLGFADPAARGRAFDELHSTDSGSGEAW